MEMLVFEENIKRIFETLAKIGIVDKADERYYNWTFSGEDIRIWLEHGTMEADTMAEIEEDLKNEEDICVSVIFDLETMTSEWTYAECDQIQNAIWDESSFSTDLSALIEVALRRLM